MGIAFCVSPFYITCPSEAVGGLAIQYRSLSLPVWTHKKSLTTMAAQVTEADQMKQFREFLGTYNRLTENCFMDCVKDFTTREVKPEETSCSESCLQKYLKMTQRISMRFQEYHIQQNEALAAKAGLLGQPR
ncbi:hypothetical protein ACEWY4_005561 [Coilia grayii]|uniref:Mitochondrial import inner membrane translocase subunit n=1 Tax=Coilia grayii TaxID=363190 RepID=A0ABD1KJB1_9TELE